MAIIVQQDSHGASREVRSCSFENEKELEDVLAAHPNLLQGSDEDEVVFIHRQVILPDGGRIDLLLTTSDALPVITEVKLGKNREAQRKIVAQIFDYVSALTLLDLYQLDELVGGKLQEIIEGLSTRSQSSALSEGFQRASQIGRNAVHFGGR